MNDMVLIRRDLCNRLTEVADAITGTSVIPGSPAAGAIDRVKLARALLRLAARRSNTIRADLLGEPGWYMLLDLYVARHEQRLVGVSSLCIASLSASTTALRAIASLEASGEISRSKDPADARRFHLSLTDDGYAAVDAALGRWRYE